MSTSPISVRVNSFNRISECADQTATRWSMTAVQLIPVCEQVETKVGIDNKGKPTTELQPKREVYAVATDGCQLAITKLDGLAVGSELCPAALLAPHKAKERKTVELNGQWKSSVESLKDQNTREVLSKPVDGRFPPVESVIPDITSDYVSLTIDVEILRQLAAAINLIDKKNDASKLLTLLLPVDDEKEVCGPIAVVGNAGFGVVMPATTNQEKYIGVFQSHANRFKENLTANTEERKAAVLAILNPDMAPKEIQPAAPEATAAELAEKAHIELHDKIVLRPSCGDVRLYPVGAQYRAYGKDASRIGEAIGMHWDVEYQGTDHELEMIAIPQECLTDYMGKFGMANVFIKLCNAL